MAELDAMIGLAPVKAQVRSIAASIEVARRRAMAGVPFEKPMRHFVFLGPPGTGKTTVARVLARIFYAFGLLQTPEIIEVSRADLIGEYLGATSIKTNELIDSALGGLLFIDQAHTLVNEGDGQADRFGREALQALLKRAEDSREDLIIILAGFPQQMEFFLASNPGLASRFSTRLRFSSYTPAEMIMLAQTVMEQRGEVFDPDARPILWRSLEEVDRRRTINELGNGWYIRNLLEKAGQARDVRVMTGSAEPSLRELVTIRGSDLEQAYAELADVLKPRTLLGHAFISYVREDSLLVDQLQRTLQAAGIPVWRDTADLWPGEDWRMKIRRAITNKALVFIACFSQASFARGISYQNEELTLAIEQLRLRAPDDPWLIPVRLNECEIPDRDIGGGRTLTSIQRVDFFGDHLDDGAARLAASILRILAQ